MSKFKNKNKLHYVKGFCELETGIVEFVGGMCGVSTSQTWYRTIYAIRDKYTHIDFWIDPKFDVCKTIHPTENFLRRVHLNANIKNLKMERYVQNLN